MARHAAAAPAAAQAIAAGAPLLPYAPSSRQAEEEERRTAAELASLREKHARVAERVERAFSGCRLLSEIEEDLVEAQARAARLGLNRDALEVALETIQRLSREQQEILAPRLNRLVEERFLRLAVGRYAEVKIDLDFNVRVREAGGADLRPASSLSRGAQDQLYLAVRFGVLDMVSGPEDACPSLLDEPFAAYDHNRLEEAFRILEEESRRRQLLLFTCREDVREMAQRHGARPLPL
jgi:uncharacterized protein YhaN